MADSVDRVSLSDYVDAVTDSLVNAAVQSCEMLEPALIVLTDLIGDSSQTGAVRVSASKLIIDTALKLDARAVSLSRTKSQVDKLDALFGIERDENGICTNSAFLRLADSMDDVDVDAYDED